MLQAGQSIGNYRILSKIGTGGMGAVYLAEHPLIGKKVALKVIHRELSSNKEVVQRFFQEARSVNKIGSEHIVEIHDFGVTDNGDHFYIMEYLEGKTLASALQSDRRFDVIRALRVGAQIASALAATHQAGIIHRDLKPDNVMLLQRLNEPDFVKVLDFGLAKVLAGTGVVKTAMGVLLGTPQYMSPEACESKQNIDHRTDIYALGILLFQMMTGQLPFDGESMGEVLVKQVTQLPPAPRGINPQIPPSVEQVLLRCLAKSADHRFPTMIALRDALLDPELYLHSSPPIAPARSVAPGEAKVDAKTVIAHAAMQKTRLGTSDGGASGNGLPLAPPPLSLGPTMYPNAGHGMYANAGPGPAPNGGPHLAATMIADASMRLIGPIPTGAVHIATEPLNNTMRIATPVGYKSRPPRKVWPIVLVFGLVVGLGGGGFAVAYWGRGSSPAASSSDKDTARGSDQIATKDKPATDKPATDKPATDKPATDKPAVDKPAVDKAVTQVVDAGVTVDAAVTSEPHHDSPTIASLVVESVPTGAEVYGPDKHFLGKTPLEIEWPIAKEPITFELRAQGYKRRTKQIVINSNTQMRLELERMTAQTQQAPKTTTITPKTPKTTTSTNPTKSGSNNHDGLMRPDD